MDELIHFYLTQEGMNTAFLHYTGWTDHPGSVEAVIPALPMQQLLMPPLLMPPLTTLSAIANAAVPEIGMFSILHGVAARSNAFCEEYTHSGGLAVDTSLLSIAEKIDVSRRLHRGHVTVESTAASHLIFDDSQEIY